MFSRLPTPRSNKSFFLFGARGTGKTTFLKHFFESHHPLWINLLEPELETELARHPSRLIEIWQATHPRPEWIVIDEVQKIPALLDVVHHGIEEHKIKFALTGSSPRKLKRGGANLLAGRALLNEMFPLTYRELGAQFNLEKTLNWGQLPEVVVAQTDSDKSDYLRSYAHTYLKEEILQEQLIRKIDPFRAFLEIAAQTNGQIMNATKIARDCGTDHKIIQSYFGILEDTCLGYRLLPFHRSIRKRQTQKPKFYFFDLGVKRAIEGMLKVPIREGTSAFGNAFEHWFILEVIRLNSYLKKDYKLSYLRTKDDAEIDLIIERPGEKTVLIEIKSSQQVDQTEISKLKALQKDFTKSEAWIVSRERQGRISDGVILKNYITALDELF